MRNAANDLFYINAAMLVLASAVAGYYHNWFAVAVFWILGFLLGLVRGSKL